MRRLIKVKGTMFCSSIIFAAILPLMLCGEAKAADNVLEETLFHASYHAEWGESVQPPIARSIHVELGKGKLKVSITGNIPSLHYVGPVDDKTFREIASLIASMEADTWPGSTGDTNTGNRRKDRCEWSVCVIVNKPEYRRKNVYGTDKGKDTPRLEAEARLCAYLKNKLSELHATVPKSITKLLFSDNPANAFFSVTEDEGRVRVCVITKGQPTVEFYAHPKLLQEILSLLKKTNADAWHGFGHGQYEPGKMPFCLETTYNTGQMLVVLASKDNMPKGFTQFCDALGSILLPLARRWQETGSIPPSGIKSFHFSESGMRIKPHYIFYRRLDDDGARAHILRVYGGKPDGDVPLNEADEQEFASILKGLASWNGFDGYAKDVLDGPGFTFNVEFADGSKIKAHGYARMPKGYQEGRDRILAFIEKRLPKTSNAAY